MRFLLILILLAVPITAPAFERNKHIEFSLDAVSLYKACTNTFVSGNVAMALAQGANDEDIPNLVRSSNWHFYANDGKVDRDGVFLFLAWDRTNENIFLTRTDALDELLKDEAEGLKKMIGHETEEKIRKFREKSGEKIYAAAGRVAHHIQDMSSPPHVMPNFHMGGDAFDKHEPNSVPNLATQEICAEIGSKTTSTYPELLNEAAKKTLKTVATPVQFASGYKDETETWEKFWSSEKDERSKHGFLPYGKYGKTFGIVDTSGGNVNRSRYDKATFDAYFNEQRKQAIMNTVRLLMFIDTLRGKTGWEMKQGI